MSILPLLSALRLPLAATLGALALSAHADPVTLADCASCNGGRYTLGYDATPLPDVDPLRDTFRITLRIDTSGVQASVPKAVALESVAIKVAAGTSTAVRVSAPGGDNDWTLVPGGLANGGCTGSGSGFHCLAWSGTGLGTGLGGVLDFVFDVTADTGALFLDTGEAHVKARFVDAKDKKAGAVLSEAITLAAWTPPSTVTGGGPDTAVPTPGALALAALGLAALGATRRRRA